MKWFVIISAFFSLLPVSAQKTISLEECESAFVNNNLILLGSKYQIDAARCAVIQAGIWDLPVAYSEINLYNPERNQWLDAGARGEKIATVQQLLYLGGKKKRAVDYANANAEMAEWEFKKLLSSLRYELHSVFYNLYFNRQIYSALQSQISNIDSLIVSYDLQAQKGNVPLKELVRLQSLSLAFKAELTELRNNISEDQKTLRILTGVDADLIPQRDSATIERMCRSELRVSRDTILDMVLQNNPDYLAALSQYQASELNIKWQRSLAVPDITVGGSYDQRGGAFQNQINFTLGVPLALWNINKGNILMAESELKRSKTYVIQVEKELSAELDTRISNWKYLFELYPVYGQSQIQNLNMIYSGMLGNFRKRNINIMEFTDFMESYNQSMNYMIQIRKQLVQTCLQINYITNTQLF